MENDFELKPLEFSHIDGVINLLQQISSFVPDQNKKILFDQFVSQPMVFAYVISLRERVLAYGSLSIEMKIRGGAMGHIEDVVVDPDYQNNGFGRIILEKLKEKAKETNCYKVSLACGKENVGFYLKNDFQANGVAMQVIL